MSDRYAPSPRVLFRTFATGAVLYSPADEIYWGLNDTGADVWSCLSSEPTSFEQIRDAMAIRHPDATVEELTTDLRDLLDALVESGLLQRHPADVAA